MMTWLRKFKESTMQQVIAILLVVGLGVTVAFMKVPVLKVQTYNWKLGWDSAFNTMDVIDEMMAMKIPNVLDVLLQNMNDDRKISMEDLEKPSREDFFNDGSISDNAKDIGAYCVHLFNKHTNYENHGELNYKTDKYRWADEYLLVTKWYEANKKFLVWNEEEQKFIDPRNDDE